MWMGECVWVWGPAISCHRRCQFKANLICAAVGGRRQPQQQELAPVAILKPSAKDKTWKRKKGQTRHQLQEIGAGKWKLQFLTGPAGVPGVAPSFWICRFQLKAIGQPTLATPGPRHRTGTGPGPGAVAVAGIGNGMSCHSCYSYHIWAGVVATVCENCQRMPTECDNNDGNNINSNNCSRHCDLICSCNWLFDWKSLQQWHWRFKGYTELHKLYQIKVHNWRHIDFMLP